MGRESRSYARLNYKAERQAAWDNRPPFEDIAEARAFVRAATKTKWWKQNFPRVDRISVQASDLSASAARGGLYKVGGVYRPGIRVATTSAQVATYREFDGIVTDQHGKAVRVRNRYFTGYKRENMTEVRVDKATMCHEMAHAALAGSGVHESHGTIWRGAYVAIVRQFLSPAEARSLKAAFEDSGLDVWAWKKGSKEKTL